MNAAELAALHHRRAARFLWGWLAGTAAASAAGNVVHGLLSAPQGRQVLAAAISVIAPMVLVCAPHAVALVVRADASGTIYRLFVGGTAALAVGAFALSFSALRDLAALAGMRPAAATALPLVLDTGIALATLGLVAIGDRPRRKPKSAPRTHSAADSASSGAVVSAPPRSAKAESNRSLRRTSAPAAGAEPASGLVPDGGELAQRIAASDATTQSVQTVQTVLDALAAGASVNAAAAAADVNFRTAQRIARAAEAERHPHLAAVR